MPEKRVPDQDYCRSSRNEIYNDARMKDEIVRLKNTLKPPKRGRPGTSPYRGK